MQNVKKVLFFIVLLFSESAYADFYTLDYPPYSCSPEQIPRGVSIHFLREVFKLTKINTNIVISNWDVALEKAKKQEIDGIFPAIKTNERTQFLTYTQEPLFTEEIVLLGKKEAVLNVEKEFNEIEGKTICSGKGFSLGSKIDELTSHKKLIRVDAANLKGCLKKIMDGSVDFLVADKLIAGITLKQFGAQEEQFYLSQKVIESTPNYLALSQKSFFINKIKDLDKAIKKLKQENYIKKLITEDFKECL